MGWHEIFERLKGRRVIGEARIDLHRDPETGEVVETLLTGKDVRASGEGGPLSVEVRNLAIYACGCSREKPFGGECGECEGPICEDCYVRPNEHSRTALCPNCLSTESIGKEKFPVPREKAQQIWRRRIGMRVLAFVASLFIDTSNQKEER